jgi:hypothetical protein
MKWRAFSRMPQWVRLSEWLGLSALQQTTALSLEMICVRYVFEHNAEL